MPEKELSEEERFLEEFAINEEGIYNPGHVYLKDSLLNFLRQSNQRAREAALREAIGKVEKVIFIKKENGEYSFGENQKTIGYNLAVDDIRSAIEKLLIDKG